MKKILLSLSLLTSLTAVGQTTYPAGVSGCIAHWDFVPQSASSVLVDVSGNQHSGVINNMSSLVGYRNRTSEAMHFNGSSSFAQVPTHAQLNPSSISIVALVNFNGFYNGSCQYNNIIYKSFTYFSTGCWAMCVSDHHYDANCNQYSPTYEQLDFAGSSAVGFTVPSSNYIQQNQWYLLVTTYDGDSLKRYQIPMDTTWVTGISPLSKAKLGSPLGTNTNDVYIGSTQNPSYLYWFNGDMDDLALFDKVLSDSEVQLIYDYFRGPKPTVTVHPTLFNSEALIASSNGTVSIKNPTPGSPLNISVYDMAGKLLVQRSTSGNASIIDLSNISSGMLFVRLNCNGETVVKRIITQ